MGSVLRDRRKEKDARVGKFEGDVLETTIGIRAMGRSGSVTFGPVTQRNVTNSGKGPAGMHAILR